MKPFSVNKNSWHYKLNLEMCKTNDILKIGSYAERYVQSKDNLCLYWRMTIWSMIKVLAVATFVLCAIAFIFWILYMIGYGFVYHTVEFLVTAGTVFSIIAIIVSVSVLENWLEKRKKIKLDKILYSGETETSLAKAKYSSWKNGFCMPVEFK